MVLAPLFAVHSCQVNFYNGLVNSGLITLVTEVQRRPQKTVTHD